MLAEKLKPNPIHLSFKFMSKGFRHIRIDVNVLDRLMGTDNT